METAEDDVRVVGRYAIHGELASGGMAAVHLGRLVGPVGFARTVAIKRLHSQYARDPEFVAMFLDEARLVARIKHPNVVPTLDVVTLEGEIFLVMEYVHGLPVSRILAELARRRQRMPVNVAVGICLGLLEGLHAAHEAKNEDGEPLGVVHRDVSPQNVLLGDDGVARVLDFGIAKAVERIQTTEDGSFKGKLGYMPPDVLCGAAADRRADIWGAGVVFWEMLTGRRLFLNNDSPHALIRMVVEDAVEAPRARGAQSTPEIDAVVLCALEKDAAARFQTAREMASALEAAATPASGRVIGEWLVGLLGGELEQRAAQVARVERASRAQPPSVGTVRTLAFSRSSLLEGSGSTSAAVTVPLEAPKKRAIAVVLMTLGLAAGLAIAFGGRAVWARMHKPAVPVTATPLAASASSVTVTGAAALPATAPAVSAVSAVAVSAPVTTVAPPPPTRTVRSATGTPKSCTPPYTIGPPPDYIRKPKLECLPR
jgi:serine/threonine-protein kinase